MPLVVRGVSAIVPMAQVRTAAGAGHAPGPGGPGAHRPDARPGRLSQSILTSRKTAVSGAIVTVCAIK